MKKNYWVAKPGAKLAHAAVVKMSRREAKVLASHGWMVMFA